MPEQREALFNQPAYGHDGEWRRSVFRDIMLDLTERHAARCSSYGEILARSGAKVSRDSQLADLPFIPAGLFKRLELASVGQEDVVRTLTSSGTNRGSRSRIYLDKTTALLQMRALSTIMADLIGRGRLPLLVIDAPDGTHAGAEVAGRSVALHGFRLFASEVAFALTPDLRPDPTAVEAFLGRVRGRPFLVFGFTGVVWSRFLSWMDEHDRSWDMQDGILLHGGGRKRGDGEPVTDKTFLALAAARANLTRVHNYYGMVEQAGSVFVQCELGMLHCSSFSDVIIRRPRDLSEAHFQERGIIQTLSVLPESYPGHNLLTEDEGVVHGEDDCGCGRKGKRFRVLGRLQAAAPKGCGNDPFAP